VINKIRKRRRRRKQYATAYNLARVGLGGAGAGALLTPASVGAYSLIKSKGIVPAIRDSIRSGASRGILVGGLSGGIPGIYKGAAAEMFGQSIGEGYNALQRKRILIPSLVGGAAAGAAIRITLGHLSRKKTRRKSLLGRIRKKFRTR